MKSAHALTALALALAAAACGYTTGFTLPESKNVGVAMFGNDSKERDVERQFHGFLADSVERLVNAPLVSPTDADYVIDGKVVTYERRGGIRSKDNVLLETGVRITVVGRLLRRSRLPGGSADPLGEVLRQVTVTDERGYLLEDPLGEPNARELVLRNIADRLVLDLFADQAYSEPR